ncbi:serine/threonine-protein phosphatase with EF-hands 2 isoform X1 [Anolis sagrei]|uniref:serine/threonine-protein phosphatase with EF-hands 2 isoform X1 n=2 Tax=Anolis sagrei TaxID=38937 RepID=UPI003520617E
MGCGISAHRNFICKLDKGQELPDASQPGQELPDASQPVFKAAVLIQRWYRRYMARLEMRRRCTWRIFQSIEYSGEQDHLKLNSFFDYLMKNFTPRSNRDKEFLHRILSEPENLNESRIDRAFAYQSVVVPDSYMGPRLSFPLFPDDAAALLEAFKQKQQLHAHYVLRLFHEARKHLSQLPNINNVSTCYSEEITVCGDLHGQLADLFLIFYKNGLPSPQKAYVFNGDFVDRGKYSMEILIILFVFLLIYPKEVHLNRGNHEDYIVNLRYGLNKEIARKYKEHSGKILKLLQNVFSCLPLATLVDQKVLIVHGGISDTTDLDRLAKIDRRQILSVLTQKRKLTRSFDPVDVESGKSSPKPVDSLNKADISKRVQEELDTCRTRAGSSEYTELRASATSFPTGSDMSLSSNELLASIDDEEIQQVLDILWSDPIPQEGCKVNEDRGGGCYFGPNVTEAFLQKHNLQFIIRSHECKPEGYDICHDRKVITVFSASNYYTVGSNRGAYVKMGRDLIPHFIQYQASKTSRRLTMTQRISRVEVSAYQVLKEKIFAHRSDLTTAFRRYDKKNTGLITLNEWANAVESVLQLGLPWRMLRPQLVLHLTNGKLEYKTWLKDIVTEQRSAVQERLQSSLLENIYRNLSSLETIFNIIDTDHSGLISLEEFHQTWKLFSAHMNIDISDESINDLARSIDFNKDGNIDFNEFIEAFRLVSQST